MKKIVGLSLGLFAFLCCYWESLFLSQETCSQQINHQCNNVWTLKSCVVDWSTIYLWWVNTNGAWSTWHTSFCEGTVYWNTWWLSWIWNGCYGYKKCCGIWSVPYQGKCKRCDSLTDEQVLALWSTINKCLGECPTEKQYTLENWVPACCQWVFDDSGHCVDSLSQYWIDISTECLLNWQCGLNVYKVLWIRKQDQNPTVLWFFQDITLASTTAILWTVIIVVIIISWLLFAFASITWKDTKRAKTILIDAFVWLLLVMWSYTIIRLIQFLATAWS